MASPWLVGDPGKVGGGMLRIIKWTIILSIAAVLYMKFSDYKIAGKTIDERWDALTKNELVKEGVKDMRAILGEGLKAAGEAISEDVTEEERKELDSLVKKELMSGKPIAGAISQVALPPVVKEGAGEAPAGAKKIEDAIIGAAKQEIREAIDAKLKSDGKASTSQPLAKGITEKKVDAKGLPAETKVKDTKPKP